MKIFSDKKFFTVDQAYNRRNDRWVGPREAEAMPVMRTKHPQGVMALGVIASDGQKMPLHFFEAGLKINTEEYLKVMQDVVGPWLTSIYPNGGYVWQQDGAPARASRQEQTWLQQNLVDF